MISLLGLVVASLISSPLKVRVEFDGKPIAKQKVELVGFKDGQQTAHDEKTSDTSGTTTFEIKPGDYHIILRSNFEEIPYFSEPVYAGEKISPQPIILKMYSTTESNDKVFIDDFRLFMTPNREDVLVEADLIIQNPTTKTLKGKNTPQGLEAFRIPLPANSHDLRFTSGFAEHETRFDGNDIVSSRPIMPGTTRLGLRYAVEKSFSSAKIHFHLPFPVREVSLATPTDLNIQGLSFVKGADKFFDGQMVKTYSAKVDSRTDFELSIGGLPLKYRTSQILPVIGFLLLSLLLIPLSQRTSNVGTLDNRKVLLEQLRALYKLRERALIDDIDFQRRRFKLLERLTSFYE